MIQKICTCDICGKEITDDHPVKIETYKYESLNYRRSQYVRQSRLDVCDDCYKNLASVLKSKAEDAENA